MVGKIKRVRQKLHQEAVKSDTAPLYSMLSTSVADSLRVPPPLPPPENNTTNKQAAAESSFPTGIFAGTKITAEALVQTLKFEETKDAPVVVVKKGPDERKVKSKKEKMKERREKWLNKISSIKQEKEQQAAEARRKATPVVGDLRPLADALPELCQLIGSPAAAAPTSRRRSRKNKEPVKRPEPTDFSQMKASQKRKLLETECSRFIAVAKSFSGRTNPLVDIGEQLRKRMRQEEENSPS